MRAVLDANIFASALMRPQGPPGPVLALLVRQRAFELVMSPAILDEVARVLHYPKVRKRIAATDEELNLWLASLDIIALPVGVRAPRGSTRRWALKNDGYGRK